MMSCGGNLFPALTASTTGHATAMALSRHERKRKRHDVPPTNHPMRGTRKSRSHDSNLCHSDLTFCRHGFSWDWRVRLSNDFPVSSVMRFLPERSLSNGSMLSGNSVRSSETPVGAVRGNRCWTWRSIPRRPCSRSGSFGSRVLPYADMRPSRVPTDGAHGSGMTFI